MAEYIKREDVRDLMYIMCAGQNKAFVKAMEQVIDDTPTADVAPVVRCRDCKYWQDNNGGYPHEDCKWDSYETPDVDDFCSSGERRDDNV